MNMSIHIGRDRRIDADAAKGLMPETEAVHTFDFTPFGAMGCDMERAELCRLIDAQQGATLSERGATFDHYLVVAVEGRATYIEAVPARVKALLRDLEDATGDVVAAAGVSARVAVPRTFWEDHADRQPLNPGETLAIPRGLRGRCVLFDTADPGLAPLLSDARYYADPQSMDECPRNIRDSAQRTVAVLAPLLGGLAG